ncbi:16S rRNA (guanine(527)-N(7))-methyltransferase RsmG [bacterium SCSIO 12696]|nr:16S rRNA (guanine(527)-N(7))-methyltransferase RsmG [bacterium SCSIO 12696]
MITLEQQLRTGIAELGLELNDQQIGLLLAYLDELHRWNKAYNLTAIRDPEQMLHLHILDSLAVMPLLQGQHFVDVGTGPGIPGIPLAIVFPEKTFQLIDSNGKKMRFVFQTCLKLKLDNVTEQQIRVEQFQGRSGGYCGVLSRAFTSVPDMLEKCHHLASENGRFYAMKGKLPTDELSALAKHYKVVASHQLQVPGVDAERHLIEISHTEE